MVVFEIDGFLNGAGIHEIKTVDGNLRIVTSNKVIIAEIKGDPEKTGFEIERRCKGVGFQALQKVFSLLVKYWDEIQNELRANSEAFQPADADDPQRYKPKHTFTSFSEWQTSVEESYHNLHKVVDTNMPHAWSTFELVLTVKAILHISEITLPFLCIIIAPSGAWKTVPIMALKGRINTFYTDGFNTHSWISHTISLPPGMKEGDQHMLNKMKDRLVLMPELATTFSKKEEELKEIIGQATRAADGQGLETDSGIGHRGVVGKCQFNLIGATTEPPLYAWKYLSQVGPKIYFFRPEVKKKEKKYLTELLKGPPFKKKLQPVVQALNNYLDIFESCPDAEWENGRLMKISLEQFSANDDDDALSIIPEFVLLLGPLRGSIRMRESFDENGQRAYIHDMNDIEDPERANEQLRNLAKAHALMEGRTHIGLEDIPIVADVTLSTTQRNRRNIFLELLKYGGRINTTQVTECLRIHRKTANKEMAELALLGLVTITESGSQHEKTITLNSEFNYFIGDEFQAVRKQVNRRYEQYLSKKNELEPVRPGDTASVTG